MENITNQPASTLRGREINLIVVHCAATPEGKDFTVKDIDRWHKDRGWKGIGYHWVIYRDGSIHAGRPEAEIGAHAAPYNAHSIGICYIGGSEPTKRKDGRYHGKDTRTPEQKASLIKLIKELKSRYPGCLVLGHSQLPGVNKSCPCFNAQKEFADL